MRFGYGMINCQRFPGDERSYADLYAEALVLAKEAEAAGFHDVWTTEHHFYDDGYSPSVLPICAAFAGATSTIRIGTAILVAPLYHPLRLAEDAATVDCLSGGRLTLGLGLGWRPHEFESLGIPKRERGRRLEDTIAVLRQAWAGELVTGGSVLSFEGVAVRPLPAQPAGPPILVAAFGEKGSRRAGRLGDGLIPNAPILLEELFAMQNLDTDAPDPLRSLVAWFSDSFNEHQPDREPEMPVVVTPSFVWTGSSDDAWEKVRAHFHQGMWKYEDMGNSGSRSGVEIALAPKLTAESEGALRSTMLVGNPVDLADQLARMQDEAGVELHVLARMYWPGMTLDDQRRSLTLFADEVMPRLA